MWRKYFNIDYTKYKIKDHSFNHSITTNGKTVSIYYIANDQILIKNKKLLAMQNASKKALQNNKH